MVVAEGALDISNVWASRKENVLGICDQVCLTTKYVTTLPVELLGLAGILKFCIKQVQLF